MLQMQGRKDAAIDKYREALSRPPTGDTYDRARQHAYQRLFVLLEGRKDLDGMEALHKRRVQEYSGAFCSGVDYASFLVYQRGDAKAAIALAGQTPPSACETKKVREVVGLAYYLAWASGTTPDSGLMVHQARVFFPAGVRLIYSLASSDRTLVAAKRLVASGEKIDQLDGNQMTALAYALSYGQGAVTRRLLELGARTDALVGTEKIPVALVPVLSRDLEGVRIMRQAGVDYSTLRHEGKSAVDIARLTGDTDLVGAMDPKGGGS
jgi:hypothetical protein